MKALILAAGFGTRLKPWTNHHPKALVPVGGKPMLERVLRSLKSEGFDEIAVNVHHFADQICDFLEEEDFGIELYVSDERDIILDTGGAILKASEFLACNEDPFLVHNVDILSDAPLFEVMKIHRNSDRDISLITSDRISTRKLMFDKTGKLCGWHNLKSDEFKPHGLLLNDDLHESSFSGIYIINPNIIDSLRKYSHKINNDVFPIMDYFLSEMKEINIGEIKLEKLNLIDIGKPDTLRQADVLLSGLIISD